MNNISSINRSNYFDSLKCYLSIVVILIHVVAKINYSVQTYWIEAFLLSFAMPLFVFISGYMSVSTINNKDKLIKTCTKLFETLVAFQIYFLLFDLVLGFGFGASLKFFYQPTWTLWYLLSLIYWRIFLYIVRKINKVCIFVSSLIIALVVGFTPLDYPFSLQRTFVFLPFFIAGVIVHERNIIISINNLNRLLSYLFLIPIIAIMILFFICVKTDLGFVTNCAHNFSNYPPLLMIIFCYVVCIV